MLIRGRAGPTLEPRAVTPPQVGVNRASPDLDAPKSLVKMDPGFRRGDDAKTSSGIASCERCDALASTTGLVPERVVQGRAMRSQKRALRFPEAP